jgi:surfactin synthase thioesterase subunit/aryl carrier-like protein
MPATWWWADAVDTDLPLQNGCPRKVVDQMIAAGTNVKILKGDATSEAHVKRILSEIKSTMPELRGIIQSAMVLDDTMLITMDKEKFMKVLRPKVTATWILHQQTMDMNLDYFVAFSSIAALYGTPGQSNYAAANVFLDKFSHYRRAKAMKGNTVNWGVLGEVGFVARTEKVDSILASQGWLKFNLRESTDCLERVMLQNPVQAGAIAAEWDKVKETFPHNDSSLRFTHLFHENDMGSISGGNEKTAVREALHECPDHEKHPLLQGHLQESVAKILGTSRDKLDTETSVTKMGLDSLMANQLRTWIHNNTGVDYSLMRIMQGPGISELTTQVLEMMNASPAAGQSEEEKAEIDKWILRPEIKEYAKKRLFCFSYLGGGASLFNSWSDSLEDVEICMVQLPGREERIDETPIHDNDELAKILSEFVIELNDKPFAFFGHSFGGGLAFALANHLKEYHDVVPEKLFIGAAPAPDVENPLSDLFNNVDGDHMEAIPEESVYKLLDALEIEESFIEDKDLMDKMMPAMKADIILMINRNHSLQNKLSCPVVVVAGEDDEIYPIDRCLQPWDKYTDKFTMNVVPGGHFFLKEETGREKLLAIIDSAMTDK